MKKIFLITLGSISLFAGGIGTIIILLAKTLKTETANKISTNGM